MTSSRRILLITLLGLVGAWLFWLSDDAAIAADARSSANHADLASSSAKDPEAGPADQRPSLAADSDAGRTAVAAAGTVIPPGLTHQGATPRTQATAADLAPETAPADTGPFGTGLRPNTPEEDAWEAANVIETRAVAPTVTALRRLNAERALAGQPPLNESTLPLAAEGSEILGSSADGSATLGATAEGAANTTATPDVSAQATEPVLPVAVDNSKEKWFPPVRSQGSIGSCVFFSQTYYTMSYLVNRSLDRDGRSTTDNTTKLSPRFTYNVVNAASDVGAGINAGFRSMTLYGAPTWAEFPYTNDYKSLPTTAAIWRSALGRRIGQTGKITNVNLPAGRQLAKQMLANGFLLNFATFIDSWKDGSMKVLQNNPGSTLDDASVGQKVVIFTNENGGGAHAMTIVGYNDDAWVDINGNGQVDQAELGAFRVVNSWGTGWGNGGFCWIAYDALGKHSLVPGVNQTQRSTEPIISAQIIYWGKLRENSTPSVVAEIDVTTARRSDLYFGFNAGGTSQTTTSSLAHGENILGNLSFSGGTGASEATIAFDVSQIADGGGTRRWFLQTTKASSANQTSTLRGFRLTDGEGQVLGSASGTNPTGGLPQSISPTSTKVTTWIDLQVADPSAPAAITDLTVSEVSPTRVTLSFSATGDDGTRGYVASYDVRRSASTITSANVGSATGLAYTPDTRVAAGVVQQITVESLTPGATLFFAVRGVDDAGKRSALSNVIQVTLPNTLTASAATLPAAVVGKTYSATLAASGGSAPRTWALTPTMTETTGTGGTLLAGTRYTTEGTVYVLPFDFPVQYPDGIRFARSLDIYNLGALLTLLDAEGASLGKHQPYSRQMEFTATGEGIFVDATSERVVVRWKGHPKGVSGKDGSLEIQSTLYPDGSALFTYGPIDESSVQEYSRATIGIDHPVVDGDDYATWESVRHQAATIPAGATSRWTPTRLPPGLSLDPATGVLSGTPTATGTWKIPVTVTDGGTPAQSATTTITLTVNPASTAVAPTITTQPADVTATAGQSASFTVAANGTPAPTFQWQRQNSGATTWTNLTGATGATYTLTTATTDTGAKFRTVATNSAGSATSNAATLTVVSPAVAALNTWRGQHFTTAQLADSSISGPTADPDGDGLANLLEYALDLNPLTANAGVPATALDADGRLTLTFLRARADLTYEVLASDDLGTWEVIATNPGTVSATAPFTVTDPVPNSSTSPQRFLRLRVTAP
jgi:hypothetical protein